MLYPKKINIKNKYCPKCFKKLCNNDIKFVKANLKVRDNWRPTSYFHPYIECKDCNVTESLPEASDILHDACCFSQGILTPNEIKNLRRKLKLTQKVQLQFQDGKLGKFFKVKLMTIFLDYLVKTQLGSCKI